MSKQKRLGASRAAMERMHRIHQLLQNRQYPNCTKLAKEFEVAKRTMKRDIEFMKAFLCQSQGAGQDQSHGSIRTEKKKGANHSMVPFSFSFILAAREKV